MTDAASMNRLDASAASTERCKRSEFLQAVKRTEAPKSTGYKRVCNRLSPPNLSESSPSNRENRDLVANRLLPLLVDSRIGARSDVT